MSFSTVAWGNGLDAVIDVSRIVALDFDTDTDTDTESGSNALLKQLVEMFLESMHKEIAGLRSLALNRDFEGLSKKAHCLKSSHLNLGVLRTVPILEKLEAKTYDQNELLILIDKFSYETEIAADRLKSIVSRA